MDGNRGRKTIQNVRIDIFSHKFKEILEENNAETLLILKTLAILSFQLF